MNFGHQLGHGFSDFRGTTGGVGTNMYNCITLYKSIFFPNFGFKKNTLIQLQQMLNLNSDKNWKCKISVSVFFNLNPQKGQLEDSLLFFVQDGTI